MTRLKDWIILDGLRRVRPAEQADGEPRMRGELRSDYRAWVNWRRANRWHSTWPARSLIFVLTGIWFWRDAAPSYSMMNAGLMNLTRICRPEAIAPDNVVLSRDMIHLQIKKMETGSVAAGYQRGWFQKIFDLFQPF